MISDQAPESLSFPSLVSSSYDSSSSIQEREDIINNLQGKIKKLLIVQKRNEKLEQRLADFKRCCEKLEQYRSKSTDMQSKLAIINNILDIPENSSVDMIKQTLSDLKSESASLKTLSKIFDFSPSEDPVSRAKEIREKFDCSADFVDKISEIFSKNIINNIKGEPDLNNIISEIRKLDENGYLNNESLKNDNADDLKQFNIKNKFNDTQFNDLCSLFDISPKENNINSALSHIKDIKQKRENEFREKFLNFAKILFPTSSNDINENKKIDEIEQIIKSRILELVKSEEIAKKNLNKKDEKIEEMNSIFYRTQKEEESKLSKINCKSFDEIILVIEDLFEETKSVSLIELKTAVSKLLSDNKKINSQLQTTSEILQAAKNKLDDTKAKLRSIKAERKDIKIKLEENEQKLKEIKNERNSIKTSISDKDEEIISLKELLQTEKGNVRHKFDEFEEKILALKSELRKVQVLNEEMITEKKELETNNTKLKTNLSEVLEDNKKMKIKINEQQKANKELKSLSEETESSNQYLSEKIEKVNKEMKEKITKFEQTTAEFNEQIKNLKDELNSQKENSNKEKMRQNEINNENRDLNKQIQILKKEKSDIFLKLEEATGFKEKIIQVSEQTSQKMKDETEKKNMIIQKLQQENLGIQSILESAQQIIDFIKDVLKIDENSQIESTIKQLISEEQCLKDTCNSQERHITQMKIERNSILTLMGLSNENSANYNSISDAVNDLIEKYKEVVADNQDLTQKVAAVATFLNIINPSTSNLLTIQKAIRDLQKQKEKLQEDNKNLVEEAQNMSQKVEQLDNTQKRINKILKKENSSSNDIVEIIADNLNTIQELCDQLEIKNKAELIERVCNNNKLVSKLFKEFNLYDGNDGIDIYNKNCQNVINKIVCQKKSFEKIAGIMNFPKSSSESEELTIESIVKTVEGNQEFVDLILKELNCTNKDKALQKMVKNDHLMNEIMKTFEEANFAGDVDSFPSNIHEMIEFKKKINEILNITSSNIRKFDDDKIISVISNLQKEALKVPHFEKRQKEIANILKVENNGFDKLKSSILSIQNENRIISDTFQRLQKMTHSEDLLSAVASMASVQNAIQKALPCQTPLNEIPTLFISLQDDSNKYKKLKNLISLSEDPLYAIKDLLDFQNNICQLLDIANRQNNQDNNIQIREQIIEKISDNLGLIKDLKKIALEQFQSHNETSKIIKNGITISTINERDALQFIKHILHERKEIEKILQTNSPVEIIRSIVDQRNELLEIFNENNINAHNSSERGSSGSDLISTNSNIFSTAFIRKVFDLKNKLSKLLNTEDLSEIYSIVQKSRQTNGDLYAILNVDSTNELLSKVTELANIEMFLRKIDDETKEISSRGTNEYKSTLKEIVLRLQNAKNELTDFRKNVAEKIHANDLNDILFKIDEMQLKSKKICHIMGISDEAQILNEIEYMQNNLRNLTEILNSSGSGDNKISEKSENEDIIQKAKNNKNLIKQLANAMNVSNNGPADLLITKIHDLQKVNNEMNIEIENFNRLKNNLISIFEINENTSLSAPFCLNGDIISIEKNAKLMTCKGKMLDKICAAMKCDSNEMYILLTTLLKKFDVDSLLEIINISNIMKSDIEKLSNEVNIHNSVVHEYLSEIDEENILSNIQKCKTENLVQFVLNELKSKNQILTGKLSKFEKNKEKMLLFESEAQDIANILKDTHNQVYSPDEVHSIFEAHKKQIRELQEITKYSRKNSPSKMKTDDESNDLTFFSGNFSGVVKKVIQMSGQINDLKKASTEFEKCQTVLSQKNFELSEIMKSLNVSSPEFVIEIINDLKRQISELEIEISENQRCKTVAESLESFERDFESKQFSQISQKIQEIAEMLLQLLSGVEKGAVKKAEMMKLIETALCESMKLREKLEANGQKWALFGKRPIIQRDSIIDRNIGSRMNFDINKYNKIKS